MKNPHICVCGVLNYCLIVSFPTSENREFSYYFSIKGITKRWEKECESLIEIINTLCIDVCVSVWKFT